MCTIIYMVQYPSQGGITSLFLEKFKIKKNSQISWFYNNSEFQNLAMQKYILWMVLQGSDTPILGQYLNPVQSYGPLLCLLTCRGVAAILNHTSWKASQFIYLLLEVTTSI